MESVCRLEEFGVPGPMIREACGFAHDDAGTVLQTIETGEFLFQPGETRTLYRVERGAICHYGLWADGRHDVIEFAFPGDIIGLGHLDNHVTTAQAMIETVVSLVSETDFEEALEIDDRLSFRQTAAVEREFDHLRDRSVNSGVRTSTARVANFLLALSSLNLHEGRRSDFISDDLTAGFVADKLNMTIENLGAALLRLKKEGAVKETARGLEIVNTAALKRLADVA